MKFEFDPAKSASNKVKHGLDFVEAQELWQGWTLEVPAKSTNTEVRYASIGKLKGQTYTAIITYRGEKIRIISIRHATSNERIYYEKNHP